MTKLRIKRLPSPIYSGDWHDKPHRWAVYGPGSEVSHFDTKANAQLYARLRRKLSYRDAMVAYINA